MFNKPKKISLPQEDRPTFGSVRAGNVTEPPKQSSIFKRKIEVFDKWNVFFSLGHTYSPKFYSVESLEYRFE